MMLLGKEKIQNIIVEVKKLAHPDPVEIRIRSQQSLFLRMSQSSLHQNTFEDNYTIHINLYGNKKRVATHTNDFSKTSLKKAVSYLKRDLQTVPEDPYLTLFPEIKRNMELKNVTEDTSSRDPKILAEFCKPILEKSRSHHLIASG
ncbi:MAG: hypothetical protein HYW47_07970, partial [Deltaproteobacteria bacterium]|nr:hypothetical protein [Deltaproteobacteria bacterium]